MKSRNKLLLSLCISVFALFGIVSNVQAQTTFKASLSGNNEVPSITTTAFGSVNATLSGTELVVEGTFENLSSMFAASHIHAGMAGENGGVVVALTASVNADGKSGTFAPAENTFTLTAEQASSLNARGLYINIHTENYAGGELRGQLVPESDAYFRATLSGAFEVPAAKTTAQGGIVAELRGDSLFLSGSFSNLTDEFDVAVAGGSHLHSAFAGSNGGIVVELTPTLATDNLSGVYMAADNAFELNADQKDALMNRKMYVNIHTKAFGSGELRGQLVPPATAIFYSSLSGTAEVPSFKTDAFGALMLELHGIDSLVVTGSFADLSGAFDANVAGGSHLHAAHAGANGGIAVGLQAEVSVDLTSGTYSANENSFTLTTEQIAELFNRNMYANIHTAASPSGELRGQVLGEANAYFRTNLSGMHEVQPVITNASGALNVEVSGDNAIVTGGFANLSSDFDETVAGGAHLHAASVSENGGVEILLNTTITAADTAGVYDHTMNTFVLTANQKATLFAEGMYANIHTEAFGGGELRGQLLFGDNAFPNAAALTSPADGAMLTISGESSTLFEATWEAGTDQNELTYIWQLSTDAEFNNLVVNANVGAASMFQAEFGVLDGLLAELGLDVGASATVYHRVITSDGSNQSMSAPRTAMLERGQVTSNENSGLETVSSFQLEQNYPNPFNPTTNIRFSLAETGTASLIVYNLLGQEVATLANERLSAGSHTVSFDASQLSSGIYIYQLKTSEQTFTKRMTLIK